MLFVILVISIAVSATTSMNTVKLSIMTLLLTPATSDFGLRYPYLPIPTC